MLDRPPYGDWARAEPVRAKTATIKKMFLILFTAFPIRCSIPMLFIISYV
jgi:hypothetical protein